MRKKRVLFSTEFSGLHTGYSCITRNLLREIHNTGRFEVAEHARYCSENDPRHQQIIRATPWKVYGNLPVSEKEEQIYNSHPLNEFGAWKHDFVCLDFQPDVVCFSENTPIFTDGGCKNIENVVIGDKVLTDKGRYRKVVKTYKSSYNDPLINLSVSNNNFPLKVTKNHPFLCVKKSDFDNGDKKPHWVNAEHLQKGDFLCVPLQSENNSFSCNLDVARLIGYYAAEGCVLYQGKKENNIKIGVQLNFNWKEQDYINEITQTCLNNFDVRIITLKKIGKNSAVLRIYSDELVNFIYDKVPGLSGTKAFNLDIIQSSKEIQQQVLTGLFRGDGGYDDRRGYYCTKSRSLAYQIFTMCLRFGIIPCMGFNKNYIKEKIYHRYMFGFHSTSYYNFKQVYNCQYNYIKNDKITKDYGFLSVKRVSIGHRQEFVYNLEVEEDNTYVAVTTCHNCSYADYWMDSYIDQSIFRRFYKTVMMPTVDACFIANTPVFTQYGIKNIQDINIEDSVISHDGSVNKVDKTYIRSYSGNLITIKANSHALPISLTENHPILIVKNKGQSRIHSYNDAVFVHAKDVSIGDYIVIPKENSFENINYFNIEDYKITLDEELAGFFGLYVAEGSVDDECKSNLAFAENIIQANSKILGTFLKNSCGNYAENKKIPDFIFKSNPQIAISFLEKLFVGDGCDTASRELAYQISRLLLQLGILSNINKHKNAYHISLYNNTKSWIDKDSGHALIRVSSIESVNVSNINVYNISVENKHSYSVGFAVHNCNQHPEWIDLYKNTDYILTYTRFAEKVLREESGNTINLQGVATPAVDTNIYFPIQNRANHKAQMGLRSDSIIVGMVARNQKRKLYPELADAFVEFVREANFGDSSNVYLYWHTSHPDVGWNIVDLIKNNGLSHKVLLTYFCNNCGFYFPSFYRDVITVCPRCHQGSCTTSNSQIGVDDKGLAQIYNCMDLYVQYITNGGLEIPALEAGACGVPVCGTYYSGVEDLIDSLEGKPIPARTFFMEAETGRKMALPSIDALVEYIQEFVSLPESIRLRKGMRTAELARKHYGSWSNVAQRWIDIFDQIPLAEQSQWLAAPEVVNLEGIEIPGPDKMSDEQYVNWLLTQVLRRPDWCNSYIGLKMWRDLSWARCTKNNLGFMMGEMSQLGAKPQYDVCNRQTLFNLVRGIRHKFNDSERARLAYINQGKIR